LSAVVTPTGVALHRLAVEDEGSVVSSEALEFLAFLHRRFEARRQALLQARVARRRRVAEGQPLGFLPETAAVRDDSTWRVAAIPEDLRDRRVEITGPVDRKLIVNALNSGAQVFMADFEDATAPTWSNMVVGQRNLADAVRRSIEHVGPDGREYRLADETATLVVRPRGWHLPERHVTVDGAAISGSLFDFGLFFFHNAAALLERGSAPYFYLPKLESHLEARLWNEVFVAAQEQLGIPVGTIRATVLVETIFAAFEMEEILFELRDHSAGLNCGRWDYLFSIIKTFHEQPGFVFADRARLGMTESFMRSYSRLTIGTCHRRGAQAIGGMAAQIPSKDPEENERQLALVRADKEREAADGHDGTWVAHPMLVPIARAAFDAARAGDGPDAAPGRLGLALDGMKADADELLAFSPSGPITEAGIRSNLVVAVRYLAAWLAGTGCVPINGLMEDLATAEISRTQLWHWIRCPDAVLDDGRPVDRVLVAGMLAEELDGILAEDEDVGRFEDAAKLVEEVVTSEDLVEFLSLAAYEQLDEGVPITG
jgi:malate synthase